MTSTTTLRRRADELGALEATLVPLLARQAELKALIKAEGDGSYSGRDYTVTVSTTETTALDSRKVKALLTPAQIAGCSRTGTRTTIRVAARLRTAA